MGTKYSLSELINQLKNVFVYKSSLLLYDEKIQDKVTNILEQIASYQYAYDKSIITSTFDKAIKQETINIDNDLSVTILNKRIDVVSKNSLPKRVKEVLRNNNIYTCLKTLALSNKCAHNFDGHIKRIRNAFIDYYDILFPGEIDSLYPTESDKTNNITFLRNRGDVFPKVHANKFYNLKNISDSKIESDIAFLRNNSYITNPKKLKNAKISILSRYGINFDIKNDVDINTKFDYLKNDVNTLIHCYLAKLYSEGIALASLQNKMFAVKNIYTAMIGQLLSKDVYKNVDYELIKTPNGVPGFEHMLIIDDKDLSYYIEVHMPDFIAYYLTNNFGLTLSSQRQTIKLGGQGEPGASAVYNRDLKEVRKLKFALKHHKLDGNDDRARVITRSIGDDVLKFDEKIPKDYKELLQRGFFTTKNGKRYVFATYELKDSINPLGDYLRIINSNLPDVDFIETIKSNENYPRDVIEDIIISNYKKLFGTLNENDKYGFVDYSINKLHNGDYFDVMMFNYIIHNKLEEDIDIVSGLMIDKSRIKAKFVYENYNNIENNNMYILFNEYIDNYIAKEYKSNEKRDRYR